MCCLRQVLCSHSLLDLIVCFFSFFCSVWSCRDSCGITFFVVLAFSFAYTCSLLAEQDVQPQHCQYLSRCQVTTLLFLFLILFFLSISFSFSFSFSFSDAFIPFFQPCSSFSSIYLFVCMHVYVWGMSCLPAFLICLFDCLLPLVFGYSENARYQMKMY
jgi:hypothetical protein